MMCHSLFLTFFVFKICVQHVIIWYTYKFDELLEMLHRHERLTVIPRFSDALSLCIVIF